MGEVVLKREAVEEYLSRLLGRDAKVIKVGELGRELRPAEEELKGFGYGKPYLIVALVSGEEREFVLETVRPGQFGHEYRSDRAAILLWQYEAFNKLPKHVRAIDVGAFTREGRLKSLGDCGEFFLLVEKAEGILYHVDLDRILKEKALTDLDKRRCMALADYLAEIHSVKLDEPGLYVRRIRDLIGHGECIMGLIDSYPPGLEYAPEEFFKHLEHLCIEWRWRLKKKAHRLSQVHGDFHPWNIVFMPGSTDFKLLDRSRGDWGEPADDLTALTINYIFYSIRAYGRLAGPFEELFRAFWDRYLERTGDEEVLEVVQPFYAWRGLVVASPIWYPTLPTEVRMKLLRFVLRVLEVERFELEAVNSYILG
ncbi:MAG TPA: aminoglycoside phosphotransferase family protein [Candidatus Bathyarchaeota archaeon]|nr:aminoglycoside phosphotransferase family protein [Candidatus Bathyarchaeota archaeon]